MLTAPSKTRAGLVDDIIFGRLIEEAAETFDWVLLDAPAGIGFGFELASSYATRAVIVSTPDPGALRDGQHTASLLLEKGIEPVELVVNRVSRRLLGVTPFQCRRYYGLHRPAPFGPDPRGSGSSCGSCAQQRTGTSEPKGRRSRLPAHFTAAFGDGSSSYAYAILISIIRAGGD